MADIAKMYKCSRCGCDTPNSKDVYIDQRYIFTSHRCDGCEKRYDLEFDFQSQGETINETDLICPWCGYEYETYYAYGFDDGDTEEVVCSDCGKHFDLKIETRRRYSTRRSLCDMPDDYTGEED